MLVISLLLFLLLCEKIYAPAPSIEYCNDNENNNSYSNNKYKDKQFLKGNMGNIGVPTILGTESVTSYNNDNNINNDDNINDNYRCNIPVIIHDNNVIINELQDYPIIYKYNEKRNFEMAKLFEKQVIFSLLIKF
jgi:hypothetical protein